MSNHNELIPPKPQIPTDSLRPFNKFCISIGMLPSSYKTSLTYEEQLLWLCNYLEETVIPTVNNNGEAVTELQNLYIVLHSYIDNYFTNLDVQEEINTKLDEMVEDGTLTNLISNYINPLYIEQNENINNFKSYVNSQLDLQNTKIEAVESGSPLVANSTAEMTDTTRVYVNITDGHWYYYNGTDWVQGGVYQAAEDSETLTNLDNTVSNIAYRPENLYNIGTVNNLGINTSGSSYPNSGGYASNFIEIPENTIGWFANYIPIIAFYDENNSFLGVNISPR